MSFLFFLFLFFICVCVCVCVCVCACVHATMRVAVYACLGVCKYVQVCRSTYPWAVTKAVQLS